MKENQWSIELSGDVLRTIRLECNGNIAAITVTQAWGEQESVTLFVEERESLKASIAEIGSQMVILGMIVSHIGPDKPVKTK
jgi:hypothetical protein